MKRFRLIKILLLFISSISLNAQVNIDKEYSFENKVKGWLSEYNVPAIGIGIIEEGEIKYVKVFGELKQGIPAPDNTIFGAASLTKPVVAMLTLKLVELGQLDLDVPLCNYWVDPEISNNPWHKKLTARIILRHQTGFSDNGNKKVFDFEPGTNTQYSGKGYKYLKSVLENKFQKSLVELTDSLLFKPIGMTDTRYYWDKNIDTSRFAFFHNSNGELYNRATPKYDKNKVNPAASLLTTVEDYCKFGIYMVNGAGLSEELYNEMLNTTYKDYGLGWFVTKDTTKNDYIIEHSGSSNGIKTNAFFSLNSKSGIVVFTNGDNGASVYKNVIIESSDFGGYIAQLKFNVRDTSKMIRLSDEILDNYVGLYKAKGGEHFTVKREGKILIVQIVQGASTKVRLYPESEIKFFNRFGNGFCEFFKNDIGQIDHMVIYKNGNPLFDTKKIE